jgi:hypothetical protein
MTTSSHPVFLLGLGAQKAGTTWLHHYISQRAEVDPGLLKEYHVWDGIMLKEFPRLDVRDQKSSLYQVVRDFKKRLAGRPRDTFYLRKDLQRDPTLYFDYFSEILAQDGINLTADITPEYSGLDTNTLARIRDGFARRGVQAKVIFLMRDPVNRCLSAIRMWRRAGVSRQGADITLPDDDALRSYIAAPQAPLLTNYHNTLDAMQAVFAPEDTYVGIYETMFRRDELDRLSAFLGFDPDYSFVEQHFNVTEKTTTLDDGVLRDAAAALAPVYEYCFARYPELRAHWRDPTGQAP